jgi:secreted trypsin-like serine protease
VIVTRRCCSALSALFVAFGGSAAAMVGPTAPPGDDATRAAILLVGSKGNSCTGVAIARDLVLTAAHCVLPGADYKLVTFDATRTPTLRDIGTIAAHPEFDAGAAARHRVTADVALVKLAAPLNVVRAALAPTGDTVAPGDRLVVAGYGLATRGDGKSGGTLRVATLVVTGQPGSLQLRLVDPATKGERAGLGACTGDSGAPVFRDIGGTLMVAGVVAWSTGPKQSDGCGGLTGVTPLNRYRAWIVEQAARMGSALGR